MPFLGKQKGSKKRKSATNNLDQIITELNTVIKGNKKMTEGGKKTNVVGMSTDDEDYDDGGNGGKCGHCETFVEDGIQCDECRRWYHNDEACSNLEDVTSKIFESRNIAYKCSGCVDIAKPDVSWTRRSWQNITKLSTNIEEMKENVQRQMSDFMDRITVQYSMMCQEIVELKEKLVEYEQGNVTKATYASMVKSKNTLVIKSTEENMKASDIKKTIMENIATNVEQVKTSKQGHLVVNFADKGGLEKAKRDLEEVKENIKVEVDKKDLLKPKIKVCNIDESEDDIITSIKEKNEWLNDICESEEDFKLVKMLKSRHNRKSHVIIKCSPTIRKAFRNRNDRVYTMYGGCCKIYDSYNVFQCYKCQGFGHTAEKCNKTQVCAKCSQEHRTKDCTVNALKCQNCSLRNYSDINHKTYDEDCRVYKEELARIKNRTDHGV